MENTIGIEYRMKPRRVTTTFGEDLKVTIPLKREGWFAVSDGSPEVDESKSTRTN
jgi:hypothetical protein